MIRILGVLDLLCALVFFIELPKTVVLVAAAYLIMKGLLFALGEDFASYIDIAIGVYLLFIAFGLWLTVLSVISAFFLLQKSLLSFI